MISNDPLLKRRITHSFVDWLCAFTDDEIEKIKMDCEKEELKKAKVVSEGENRDNDHRKSQLNFFSINDSNRWIFDRFNTVIESINNQFYDFDLYGYKSFQYTVYDSSYKGEYNWHMDTILGDQIGEMRSGSTRKLTLVMLLSEPTVDFSGGEFQLNLSLESRPIVPKLKKGTIIVFPSFLIHRVTPVHLGIRKSIVIWVEGPKFR